MYLTDSGKRVLNDVEWAVFSKGLQYLTETMILNDSEEEEDDVVTGVNYFDDELDFFQGAYALLSVAEALVYENVDLAPTAFFDAAISAVFSFLKLGMALDLDEDDTEIPQLLRQAALNQEEAAGYSLYDQEAWEDVIDDIHHSIISDRDFNAGAELLDLPEEEANDLRAFLGINEDYFTAVPPHVTQVEATQYFMDLRDLYSSAEAELG